MPGGCWLLPAPVPAWMCLSLHLAHPWLQREVVVLDIPLPEREAENKKYK